MDKYDNIIITSNVIQKLNKHMSGLNKLTWIDINHNVSSIKQDEE